MQPSELWGTHRLPEQNLPRKLLDGWAGAVWRPVHDKRLRPLAPCHKHRPDAAPWRKVLAKPVEMRLLAGERHAWSRVHAPLHHDVTIVFQPLPKEVCRSPCSFRRRGQIKRHEQPSHLEAFGVHG